MANVCFSKLLRIKGLQNEDRNVRHFIRPC